MVCIIGLALLQKHGNLSDLPTELVEAPHNLMQEAVVLHPFAEACYTVRHYLTGAYFLRLTALYDYTGQCFITGATSGCWKKPHFISMCMGLQTRRFNSMDAQKVTMSSQLSFQSQICHVFCYYFLILFRPVHLNALF